MTTLKIETAPVFRPLLVPARYKGAHGGRGSGKSRFFGSLMCEECLDQKGTLAVCIREVQKTLAQSSKRLIENTIAEMGIGSEFRIFHDKIQTPGDGLIIFQGMQDHTAESIKSLEGFRIAWAEEAQTLSKRSLALLRPTIRADGSQIWASWNARRAVDAIDEFFRGNTKEARDNGWTLPAGAVVVQANWRDNPWFNDILEAERQLDLKLYPDRYPHIWEGEYAKAFEGAYFARELAQARMEGRIGRGRIGTDPLIPIKGIFDIGGAGRKSDANTIWITQWVGREIRILDYIEGQSQGISYYVNEMRSRGWGKAIIYLPHDGVKPDYEGKSYADHWRDAGFEVPDPTPNQGTGAAMQRIEAVRRIFPQLQFAETPAVTGGLDAIGFYHERKDEARSIGLGPEHDWSSHAADALGLLAIIYEAPYAPKPRQRYSGGRGSGGSGSWESA